MPDFNPLDPTAASATTKVDTNADTPPPSAEQEPQGLDKFAKLFDNDTTKDGGDGDNDSPAPFDPIALLNDEEAVAKLTSSLDFTSSISKETQELLANNDPKGLPAMMQEIGTTAFMQALKLSTAMNAKLLDEKLAQQSSVVSNQINASIDNRELAGMLPEITNPVIAAGINPYVKQLRAQNPSMSTKDIANNIKEIFGLVNSSINPNNPPPNNPAISNEEIDWEQELGMDFSR